MSYGDLKNLTLNSLSRDADQIIGKSRVLTYRCQDVWPYMQLPALYLGKELIISALYIEHNK